MENGKIMLQQPPEHWSHEMPEKFLPFLRSLWEAIVYAEDTTSDYWDFAVSISSLISQGLS